MASIRKRSWSHQGESKTAWQLSYTGPATGKRTTRTFDKKKDAEAFRVRVEGDAARGERSQATPTAVAVVCERFIRFQEMRLRDGLISRAHYEKVTRHLDLHIKPYFGEKLFSRLSPADVEGWIKWLSEKSGRGRARLAGCTIVDIRSTLKLVERFGVKRGYAVTSVIADTLNEHGTPEIKPIQTFTPEEVRRILAAAEQRVLWGRKRGQLMTRCFVHLATFCGLRVGEIAALKPENIDFEEGVIRVRFAVDGFRNLKGPKTAAGVRDVVMPEHVTRMLREYLAEFPVDNDAGVVFSDSERRGPICHQSFRHHWYRILFLAGLVAPELGPAPAGRLGPIIARIASPDYEKPHFHALRHFCASSWIANGMPLPDAATALGHSRFDMTLKVYAHPVMTPARNRATAEQMAGQLLPKLLPKPEPMRQGSDIAA